MQIPVLVEPIGANGYRASGFEPLALSAEGATSEEALEKLRQMLNTRLQNGTKIVPLEVTVQEHPLARFAGIFPQDDPDVQEWLRIMAENRRKMDEDPDIP